MKELKLIIIGSQLSGKTTLVKYLRSHSDLRLLEMEEELMMLNDNTWPDDQYKDKVLIPKISQEISDRSNIVFVTTHFELDSLRKAKARGFSIIELKLDKASLLSRNQNRIKDEGYDDASMWIDGHLDFLRTIEEAGLVDKTIDASQPVEIIANEIMQFVGMSA